MTKLLFIFIFRFFK